MLSSINITTSYISAKVLDEIYFNNERAFQFFSEYFKSGTILSASEVNHKEVFYLPNILNLHNCKFIRYGQDTINKVLEPSHQHYYTRSVVLQLEKNDRNFVYHVKLISRTARKFKFFLNNDRIYKIHLNINKKASNFDILKSYYFAMLLDV